MFSLRAHCDCQPYEEVMRMSLARIGIKDISHLYFDPGERHNEGWLGSEKLCSGCKGGRIPLGRGPPNPTAATGEGQPCQPPGIDGSQHLHLAAIGFPCTDKGPLVAAGER